LRLRLDSDAIVDSFPQTLIAAEVTLSGLHADVPEQELNLPQLSASGMAKPSARSPKIVRG